MKCVASIISQNIILTFINEAGDSSLSIYGTAAGAQGVGCRTRPDTRLPKSCTGRQGPYLRSLDHLGRSSEAKDRKNKKK